MARKAGIRCSTRPSDWNARDSRRSREGPDNRWKDEIKRFAVKIWHRMAQCRDSWGRMGMPLFSSELIVSDAKYTIP